VRFVLVYFQLAKNLYLDMAPRSYADEQIENLQKNLFLLLVIFTPKKLTILMIRSSIPKLVGDRKY